MTRRGTDACTSDVQRGGVGIIDRGVLSVDQWLLKMVLACCCVFD